MLHHTGGSRGGVRNFWYKAEIESDVRFPVVPPASFQNTSWQAVKTAWCFPS